MSPPHNKLILASQSPRRVDLLRELGLDFDIIPASITESTVPEDNPEENAIRLAREKAQWVAERNAGRYVLGADTIVVLDNTIIGKPRDEQDALNILQQLGGKTHQVITGLALVLPDGEHRSLAVTSTVHIKPCDESTLLAYIATGEPMDKAGAYAIQGEGSFLVDRWAGSWSNIVGLPQEAVVSLLGDAGYPFDGPDTPHIKPSGKNIS